MTPAQLEAVVTEARSWVKTPFVHRQRVKGGGVDCAQLLIAVYSAAGLIDAFDTGFYTSDWFLHRSEEQFIGWLERYADRVDDGEPGDVALYRFGLTASHGAIIVEPGMIIHAHKPAGCVELLEMRALRRWHDSYWRIR